ncbi:MAG: sugar phosphate nucleotidyltransferase [Oscillospiraceae bacterium]
MKAIVMAGGEGTRLRPLTINRPKPMINLMDKPVLEYILALLKQNAMTEVCLTLRYMPDCVTGYFGDGSNFGMRIESRVEREPLGTAGSVRSCADFLNGEDFIVISGDAVCDFDLKACAEFHRRKDAEVTIVLCGAAEPLEYGLAVTGRDGRIERFVEKPAWDGVVTDLVNTGIYIIKNSVLSEIPEGKNYDFGRDLFPKLLAEGRRIYGVRADGYWCDVGSAKAYLGCCMDVLKGKVKIPLSAPVKEEGVRSASKIPHDAKVTPPVYIGENVKIGHGAVIGPGAFVGAGCVLGDNVHIEGSAVLGAALKNGARASGSVIDEGAVIGINALAEAGSVVGAKAIVGDECVIAENVKVWPEREVPFGTRVTGSLVGIPVQTELDFGAGSAVSGEAGAAVTPVNAALLGAGSALWKKVGVSHCGGEAARVLSAAFSCGVCAAGGDVTETDASTAAAVSFTGRLLGLPLTVFFNQSGGNVSAEFFGAGGTLLSREGQRKVMSKSGGDVTWVPAVNMGKLTRVTGIPEAYASWAMGAKFGTKANITVSVSGRGAENRALKDALCLAGVQLCEKRTGVLSFEASPDGFSLSAYDEEGRKRDFGTLMLVLALTEFERGEKTVAAPYGAPAALETLAKRFEGRILRLGRDGTEAEELYINQGFMRDAACSAVRICSYLAKRGESLAAVCGRAPHFSSAEREVAVREGRGRAMRCLADSCCEMAAELFEGMRVNTGRGWVHITPRFDREALIIRAEGETEEIAEELISDFERRAAGADEE